MDPTIKGDKMGVFGDFAHKYHEQGFQIIPVKGKIAFTKGFQKYSTEPQPTQLIEAFVELHPSDNIGLILGAASRVCAIDIDTDDEYIKRLVPASPVRKVGAKGETRFFYTPNGAQGIKIKAKMTSCEKRHEVTLVEVLATGNYTVMPPSIHPETGKPYYYVGESLLGFDVECLPELDLSWIDTLKKYISESYENKEYTSIGTLAGGGRNNTLKSICVAMLSRGESDEDIIKELDRVDETFDKPLFQDPGELYYRKKGSETFLNNIKNSLTKKGISINQKQIDVSELFSPKTNGFLLKGYPIPTSGFIRDMVECGEENGSQKDSPFFLAAGYTVMAGAISLRFVGEIGKKWTITPNIYNIIIGETGSGKEAPQSICKKILADTGLKGRESYKSDKAFIMKLPEQRARVDIMDEMSNFLGSVNGRESWERSLDDVMASVWSKANGTYEPPLAATDKDMPPEIPQPCISILGATTPSAFSDSVTILNTEKGLLPRCILFLENYDAKLDQDVYKFLTSSYEETRWHRLNFVINKIIKNYKTIEITSDNMFNKGKMSRFEPRKIPMDDKALRLYASYVETKRRMKYEELWQKYIGTRAAQNASKIALIASFSSGEAPDMIRAEHVELGIETIETSIYNAQAIMADANCRNKNEKDLRKVLTFIRENGNVTRSMVYRKFHSIYDRIKSILNNLIEAEIVEQFTVREGQRSTTFYRIVDKP